MKENSNNKQLYWLIYYDKIVFANYKTMAKILELAQDRRMTFQERVDKILELYKEYQKDFNEYRDWFVTNYYFDLDYSLDFQVKKNNYCKSFFCGKVEVKNWLN